MYNMASSKHKLNFKSYRQDDSALSLTPTSILLGTHNLQQTIYLPVKILPLVNGKL